MSIDYTLLYKRKLAPADQWDGLTWDLFLSAFNDSARVRQVFEKVQATTKYWLVQPEYGYAGNDLPSGRTFSPETRSESEFFLEFFAQEKLGLADIDLCVDITGFMRPHLMFLLWYLRQSGVEKLDVLYSDPVAYTKAERTEFTKGAMLDVRQVSGFEGQHTTDSANDLLIIGTGYDDRLMRAVAEAKAHARKAEMFGLPSLQPDMYQQNVFRVAQASEAIGPIGDRHLLYAPANDPFVTAEVLQEYVTQQQAHGVSNIYLSPLGTKPQTLGFALYYLTELQNTAASIIFPFAESYDRETSTGLARTWVYTVEMNPWS